MTIGALVSLIHYYSYFILEAIPTQAQAKPPFDFSGSKTLVLDTDVVGKMVLATEHLDLFLIEQNRFLCNVLQVYLDLRNTEDRYMMSSKFWENIRCTQDNDIQTNGWTNLNWLYNDQVKHGWSQRGLGFSRWLGLKYNVSTVLIYKIISSSVS